MITIMMINDIMENAGCFRTYSDYYYYYYYYDNDNSYLKSGHSTSCPWCLAIILTILNKTEMHLLHAHMHIRPDKK